MSVLAGARSSARRGGWVALVIAGLVLAGCGGGSDPGATVTRQEDVSAAKTAPPAPEVPTTWPLTGMPVEDDFAVRAALAVKIENSTAARPQTGLEQADMVWEEVVEGGITRFVAVYHSQAPEEVGPIRSVRPMDARIVGPLRGMIAFSGGQAQYVRGLRDAGLQVLSQDEGAPGFFRKTGVARAPHNVYGYPQRWWDAADAEHSATPPRQLVHARTADQATARTAGTPAASVAISMSGSSKPTWTWDEGSSTWLRSEGTAAAQSRAGVRLAATNVVVLRVEVVNTSGRDPAGNPIPDTRLEGSGEALIATGGHTVVATWSKAGDREPVVLTMADGATVSLAPGNTWVQLVPISTGSVTVS